MNEKQRDRQTSKKILFLCQFLNQFNYFLPFYCFHSPYYHFTILLYNHFTILLYNHFTIFTILTTFTILPLFLGSLNTQFRMSSSGWSVEANVWRINEFQPGDQNLKTRLTKPGSVAFAVILATGIVDIGCLRWQVTPKGPMLDKFGNCTSSLDMEPQGIRPKTIWFYQSLIFMSALMLFNSICIKGMIGNRPRFDSQYR